MQLPPAKQRAPAPEHPPLAPAAAYVVPPKAPLPSRGDLRISVPQSPAPGLGDAIDLQRPYDKVSQLPTPVISSGAFPDTLDVRKRNGPRMLPSASPRVLSEFDPGRLALHLPCHAALPPTPVRHTSNPLPPAHQDAFEMPLPPLELQPAPDALRGLVFYAPRTNAHYLFDKVVGTGAFSVVVAARGLRSPDVVAVKIISVPLLNHDTVSNFSLYLCRELGILSRLHHPCIVRLLDYNVTLPITQAAIDASFDTAVLPGAADLSAAKSNKQYFFLEYCPGGNLFQWLQKHHHAASHSTAFWNIMARVVAELVVTLAYLHANDVVHRDIKLENVLLNDTLDPADSAEAPALASPLCTLTDFGLSKHLELPDQLLSTKCGSDDYVSPELLMGILYDGKLLDAWSLGVVVYAILEDRLPFDVPPLEYMSASGVSPSVLKRRRNKHNPAHRIAMIDWDWFKVAAMEKDETMPEEARGIIANLVALVEALLVRKNRRMSATQLLHDERFSWIKACVPAHFYAA